MHLVFLLPQNTKHVSVWTVSTGITTETNVYTLSSTGQHNLKAGFELNYFWIILYLCFKFPQDDRLKVANCLLCRFSDLVEQHSRPSSKQFIKKNSSEVQHAVLKKFDQFKGHWTQGTKVACSGFPFRIGMVDLQKHLWRLFSITVQC